VLANAPLLPDQVVVVDISQPRIDAWNSDKLPIYEPRLDDVVLEARCVHRNRPPRAAEPPAAPRPPPVRAARSPPHA